MKKKSIACLTGIMALFCLWSCSPDGSSDTDAADEEEESVCEKAAKADNNLEVSAGTVERYLFRSDFVDARNVDVWLPEGYSAGKRYAVLYMQDGQMLYDAGKTWNAEEWDVETVLTRLSGEGRIRNAIVVGIWNNGDKRHGEYFPQKALPYIGEPEHGRLMELLSGNPLADAYLKFLVKELKPFIDRNYSVRTDRGNTFLCGSSMGGLISIYAMCEYPDIFGGATCLSTHWIGTFEQNERIPAGINEYLEKHLPSPDGHKVYFDHGTAGLDANYQEHQKRVDDTFLRAGYDERTFRSLEFPGDDHSEKYWSSRLHIPLAFILAE